MALSYHFVFALTVVYGTTLAFKRLREYDVPLLAVEILAGIVFGSVLGLIGPSTPGYEVFLTLAAFGLMMVMFDAGLELDPDVIKADPKRILTLGSLTFFLPFVVGGGFALGLGLSPTAAYLTGVTISTTSLGLVYPLLEDFALIDTDRGQVILSVAVLNDIFSVAALAYGVTYITSPRPVFGVGLITVILLVFFVALPFYLDDYLGGLVTDDVADNPVKVGVFGIVGLAFLMEQVGIHAILGAFFAGLLIATITHEGHRIERAMQPVTELTAPVFFFYVGLNFSFAAFTEAGLPLLVAIVGIGLGMKVVGAAVGGALTGIDRTTTTLLAAAMPGRLSISVAAAEVGRTRGIISPSLYDAFLILSVLSVLLSIVAFRQFVTGDRTGDAVVTH